MRKAATIGELPGTAPIFPLNGALLLPHTSRPLNVFEPRYIDMVDAALGGDRLIVLVQPLKAEEESPPGNVELLKTGCLGRIVHFEESADDHYLIVLEGVCRVRLGSEVTGDDTFRRFEIDATAYEGDLDLAAGEDEVDRKEFVATIRAYADYAGIDVDWEEVEQTGTADLVNLSAMLAPFGSAEKQHLLEAPTLKARADALVALAEVEMARSRAGHVLQ